MGNDKVAIIGMAGRFPKADSVEEFWNNLLDGKDCITRGNPLVTEEDGYSCIHGFGKMDDIYAFDNEFFDISSRDARRMEPQERILLECAYHALEDAGYAFHEYEGKIGIICGSQENEYYLKDRFENKHGNRLLIETEKFLNSGISLTGRISYKLNLTGPSIVINTACSTSLTAVQLAADMLRNGKADLMLAGGTNVSIDQESYVHIEGMSAKDGVVRPFDKESSGFVPGSGTGVVVLKNYETALQDGDRIYAVVKGGAVGNDGNRKAGYTAPSVQGEYEVIQEALGLSEVTTKDVGYIETHGTATVLGDSIELRALERAYENGNINGSIPIGSLKGNYGHLNSSAGIASVIKTCLILKEQVIPPSIHYETGNEEIQNSKRFYVNTEKQDFKEREQKIENAGISSFGIGGMNTHVILGAVREENEKTVTDREELIVYSTKNKSMKREYKEALETYLQGQQVNRGRISYTSILRREAYSYGGYLLCGKDGVQEPIATGQKKVILQIYAGMETNAFKTEMSDRLPGFTEAYEMALMMLEADNTEQEMEKQQHSYLCAFAKVLENMGFEFSQMSGSQLGKEAIETARKLGETKNASEHTVINENVDFCIYLGDGDFAGSLLEKDSYYVLKLDKKDTTWSLFLQYLGIQWMKKKPLNWKNLFFREQLKVCHMPSYPFQKTVHKLNFSISQPKKQENEADEVDCDKVCGIFKEESLEEEITADTVLTDIDMDSMMILIVKSKIEETFHCTITIEELYTCETVRDVMELIQKKHKKAWEEEVREHYDDIEELFEDL